MLGGSETVNPSKVLHVRSLPQDCTEQDLIGIACPFGRVVSVLLLKGKGQAFVQMENVQCATALTQYYNTVQANIRNRPIYFQYSNREEIATPSPGSSSSSGNSSSGSFNEKQNNILLVTVLNLVYPVGIDVLHRVFSKYGQILKIVIFSKSAGFQALIQFSDVASAVQAKQELDGQNIYAGCCTLKIQYSNLSNLTVKFNNESSRDFTNPTLPTTAPATVSGAMPLSFPGTDATLQGWPWLGTPSMGSPYVYTGTSPKSLGNMNGVPPASGNAQCAVLIVSGLDPDKSTPDTLFTLFGVYGDVTRVKILYNKKDTALIQFSTPQQAETALVHLNGCPLYGGTLRVNFSKHQAIAMPRPGADQATDLTQDFTGSPLHRYKVLGSKNFHHIFPPSPVLHLSNLPLTVTEEQLREEFAKFGTVANFKFFAKDKRMGLIQMGSVSEAVEALIGMHNARLDESNIRVSFSKASM